MWNADIESVGSPAVLGVLRFLNTVDVNQIEAATFPALSK